MQRRRLVDLLIVCALAAMVSGWLWSSLNTSTVSQLAGRISQQSEVKLNECRQALDQASGFNQPEQALRAEQVFETQHIGLYMFYKDSVVFWNNSRWQPGSLKNDFRDSVGLAKLDNGYFIYARQNRADTVLLAMCLLKPQFGLENNYLSNNFSGWLQVPEGVSIEYPAVGINNVFLAGKKTFSIKTAEAVLYDRESDDEALAVFIFGFVCLLGGLLLRIKQGTSPVFLAMAIAAILGVRALMLYFHQPAFIYRSGFFDPRLFGNAASLINGFLGDVLFNSITLLFTGAALHIFVKRNTQPGSNFLIKVLPGLLSLFVFLQFNRVLVSLVNNSTFNFNFLSILSIKPTVAVALGAVGLMALALFIAIHTLWVTLKAEKGGNFIYWGGMMVLLCVDWWLNGVFLESAWILPFGGIIYFFTTRGPNHFSLALGLQVLLLSIVTSSFLNSYIEKNQALDFAILTQRLGERQDQILESEYRTIPKKIANDENLKNLFGFLPESAKEIQQILRQKYFNGYFDRYKMEFSVFDKNCIAQIGTDDPVLLNEGYFDDRIKQYSMPVVDGLYFVKDYLQNTQYLLKLEIGQHKLFARIEARQFEEAGSFPELFLDRSLQTQEKLRNLSYAVYRSGQNTSRYGEFSYPYFLSDSATLARSSNDFTHFYFEPEPSTHVIISRSNRNWAYFFTFNSYLLLFFSLLTYVCYLVYAAIFTSLFHTASLTRRIQTIIIALLLVAMSAVGIISGRQVTAQFEAENRKQLEEKNRVIVSELNTQFGSSLFDDSQKELINGRIREYSRLFNTPISLFDKRGMLFTTSEPKLYDFGLASGYLNPRAYVELAENLSSAVSENETAGTLKYSSLYTPLYDQKKTLSGFINLPYFARQSSLANELSEIISALINVYVILFVLSIVAGLILTGYITQPLRLIKQQIARITLGSKNEKISWQSNDEIGRLVAEYNQMLLKLEESAELLAKSEREGAWREMARQVAHEIKNPLTPMKLNLQYLQHLIKSNPDDFKERFERASAGIIEQIDSLAAIATEFSNFARLPGTQLKTLNIVEIVSAAVSVFEGENEVVIQHQKPDTEFLVLGDHDQCLRVFNNIIKNAVQAVDGVQAAKIEISYTQKNNQVEVHVKDNGCGIAEELKSKIFSPNFTTKSSGSGLGLAMVKNIIDGFGGSISFESEENNGTTFYIRFVRA